MTILIRQHQSRVNFWCWDITEEGQQDNLNNKEPSCWTASPTSKDVIKLLKLGYFTQVIIRHGMTKENTWYDVNVAQ